MRILAIETSCDETGVAILSGKKTTNGFRFVVEGSALLSQAALHAPYGGVYPTLAKREHEKNLPIILMQALLAAKPTLSALAPIPPETATPEDFFSADIGAAFDAMAVTQGPGLEPALWCGITFAQKLAAHWHKPLLPINHMEGHLISSLAVHGVIEDTHLPTLALLISGGHTEFVLMREWFVYEKIGETLDDALGEAFDQVARMLDLPYPGGPHISKLAKEARAKTLGAAHAAPKLPRPMIATQNCDMSFSGLKTAVLYALRDRGGIQMLSEAERADFAREFEDAATEVLIAKTRRALQESGARTFVIGGGVAANTHIRSSLEQVIAKEFPDVSLRLPEVAITGDNAIMIAMAALARALSGTEETPDPASIRAAGNLSI